MLSPNELTSIIEDVEEAKRRGARAALVTVVFVSESAYRRPGARMLVRDDGHVAGGVSGGCLEADVVRRARAAMLEGRPAVVGYDATDDEDGGFGAGLGCRGEVEVLIEPAWLERTAFHLACLRRVLTARQPSVLALRFRGPESDLGAFAHFLPSGESASIAGGPGTDLAGLRERVTGVLEQRCGQCVPGEAADAGPAVSLEYLLPLPRLLVVGGGPASEPLAACAHALGFRVTVVDERPGYLSRRRFPRETATSTVDVGHLARREVDAHTACIVATHNLAYDARALRGLLPSAAGYIGVLGPRKRTARLVEQLRPELEGAACAWERLYAPTGLDIGSGTPEQIALSILAEVQAVMTGRPGGSLRNRTTPIHEDASDPARGGGSMSRPGRIAAILLAAGESARLGRPKQLLPFRGRTLLRHAAETALRSSCEEVFVVLGAAGESVRPQLDGLPVQVVLNAEWREGMGTSIRCGLRAALHEPRPLDGALMLLADQPLVTAEHLSRMVALFRCGRAPIVAAHYDGHPGAPVLFGDALFSELLRLEGGSGARQIVAASSSETLLFELPEAAVDVDVEAEYQALLER